MAEVLNLDLADPGFADEVADTEGGAQIRNCYACGACSALCPVLPQRAEYDPRRIIRLILLGQRDKVLAEPFIWYCSTCLACQEVCPQGVNFTEISFAIKNLAVAKGYMPAGLSGQVDLLSEHGRLYEIGEFENDKRTKQGLPPLKEMPRDLEAVLASLRQNLKDVKSGAEEGGE